MRTSEQLNEIAAALAKAQRAIEGAKKDSVNPHYKNKYADLAAVWDACREPLTANGICAVQPLSIFEGGQNRTVTRLIHSSGQWIEDDGIPLILSKEDMQGLGSALTYSRRYGLMSMAGIAPEDDDGNAAVQPKSAGVAVEAPAMPDVDVPPGAVLIKRVEQFKATTGKTYWTVTDHKNLTYKEWDQRRASMLEQYAQDRVPVILTVKDTKWGRDISAVQTAQREIQREPPLTDDELAMPF